MDKRDIMTIAGENMPTILRALFFAVSCVLIPLWAYAAVDSFTIEALVDWDDVPPTAPTLLSAVPVESTQISLTWSASTDDVQLAGYHVWRDGVQIATTTELSYDDIELLPNTSYTYYITAYDAHFNDSVPSNEITLHTGRGSLYGSQVPLDRLITSIQVFPEQESARLEFTTRSPVKAVVKWGRTAMYEQGSLVERAYTIDHETIIDGLTPGTTYYFIIEGETHTGRYGVLHLGSFTTAPPEDVFPPDNVTALKAVAEGGGARLSWDNPRNLDFTHVRIVRNSQFYPVDPADGWVVYEGDGESAYDSEAFQDSQIAYYTVFSYDAKGNISSGAVVHVTRPGYEGSASTTVPVPEQNALQLQFSDFTFMQEGTVLEVRDGTVYIDGSKQLTISVPYDLLPQHLKTILVVIHESSNSDRSFSFLLRINGDKTAYTGTVAPFGVSGDFPIQIAVFDFKTLQIGYADGELVSEVKHLFFGGTGEKRGLHLFGRDIALFLLALAGIVILAFYTARRLRSRHRQSLAREMS